MAKRRGFKPLTVKHDGIVYECHDERTIYARGASGNGTMRRVALDSPEGKEVVEHVINAARQEYAKRSRIIAPDGTKAAAKKPALLVDPKGRPIA